MPQTVFLGRSWKIASDAVIVPASCSSVTRILWSALLIGLFLNLQKTLNLCSKATLVDTFVSISIAFFLLTVLIELAIIMASLRGSLVQTEERAAVPKLVGLHFVIGVFQFIWAMLGLLIVSNPEQLVSCPDIRDQNHVDILVAVIAISQLTDLCIKCCCCVLLAGNEAERGLPVFETSSYDVSERRWRDRCRVICSCAKIFTCNLFHGGGALDDLEMASRGMAEIFFSEGYIDIAPSDIAAGFVLLRHVQKRRENELLGRGDIAVRMSVTSENEDENSSTTRRPSYGTAKNYVRGRSGQHMLGRALQPDDKDERDILEEGTYFNPFAIALYTWMMFMYMHPGWGVPRLWNRRLCKMDPRIKKKQADDEIDFNTTQGDNCFRAHEAAIYEFIKGKDAELVYANFTNTVYDRPYAIFIDRKWSTVIISIRGTLSLEDCLADANHEPAPLDEVGKVYNFDGTGQFCHSGMLNAADCIYKDLYRHRIVHYLLKRPTNDGTPGSPPSGPATPLNYGCQGYSLRVVGHSLGAGSAAILTLMLRRDFPEVRCLAYGMPGAMVTEGIAEYCKPFMTSFVLGRDIVPRLSFGNLRKIRDDVLDLIARCKVNKTKVLHSLTSKDPDILEKFLYPPGKEPDSDFRRQLKAYQDHLEVAESRFHEVPLIPPGRVVYYVRVGEHKKCCGTEVDYEPIWATPEDFNEIYISPTMLTDHLPDAILAAMESVCQKWKIDS